MASQQPKQDHWSTSAYKTSASFVPQLASKVMQWLDPQPNEVILDLGCGDGALTAQIKSTVSNGEVTGLDSSENFITDATNIYGSTQGLDFGLQDCRRLDTWVQAKAGRQGYFDKVFSNAALHWILRDESTRLSVFEGAFTALKPGGAFVFEMGGAGNVAEVHAAFLSALVHHGLTIEEARKQCPWYFPSEAAIRKLLEKVGFSVQRTEIEYRPTRLTEDKDGGLKGWARLMGAQMMSTIDEGKREDVVNEVCDVLDTVISRADGEGGMWLGYVRLRVYATR